MSRSRAAASRMQRPLPRVAMLAALVLSLVPAAAQAAPVAYSYAVSGTTSVPLLIKRGSGIAGTASARTDPATGAFAADLAVSPFDATLVTQGALPVTAKVQLTPTGPLVGTNGASGLAATVKVRLKLTSLSVAGAPIAPAATCQFSQLSVVTLRSASSTFNPAVGGTLAGTFPTSNLVGCSALSGLVSPATSANGNALTLTLSGATARPARYSDEVFSSVTETDGVQYSAPVGPDTDTPQPQLLDIYQPAGDTNTRRPAIVWAHGGSFIAGDRKEGLVSELARRFALRGYVTVSIDYRLLATTPCAGANYTSDCSIDAIYAAKDATAAVKYLRTNAGSLGIDPNRIAVGGDSAGAIAAILTGGPHGAATDPGHVSGVVSISGGSPTTAVFQSTSAPTVFWHGTADTTVPYSWAVSNNAALTNLGIYSVLHSVQGAGHVPVAYLDDMDATARDFLYRVMSLHTAAQ